MTTEVKLITPAMAEEMLRQSEIAFFNYKGDAKQRKVLQSTVDLYADDMKNGKWDENNGEPLQISKEGAVTNGVHRLNAIIKSGVSIKMLIVTVDSIDSIKTIDIGRKRSLESTLEILGSSFEKGAGSIVKQKLQLDRRHKAQSTSDTFAGISRIEQVEEYSENEAMYNYIASYAKKISKMVFSKMLPTEIGGIYAHLFFTMKHSSRTIEDFFESLANTDILKSNSIYATTMRALENKNICRGSKRINEYLKCWNAKLSNRRTRKNLEEDEWFRANVVLISKKAE